MILQLDIPMADKNLVLVRFRRIFGHIDGHYRTVQRYYNSSRTFVITASILNPALLSITSTNDHSTINVVLFWLVWSLQILVSLVTAYIAFFKWDKKYFVFMLHKQRAEQEIWTYLELTGKYSIVNPLIDEEVAGMRTTHRSKLKLLMTQLEMIYRKLQEADANIQHMDNEHEEGHGARTPPHKHVLRAFTEEIQQQQQKRLEATERKLHALTQRLQDETDPSKRRDLKDDIEQFEEIRQRNQQVDGQLLRSLEQNLDHED